MPPKVWWDLWPQGACVSYKLALTKSTANDWTTNVFAIWLYGDWTPCCYSCWPSTILEGVQDGVEPESLECEVKRALESITTNKASGGDGILVELFQILKMMLWKCCTHMPADLENSAVATGLEKVSFHSNPKERQCQRMLKLPHNCTHLTH